MYVALCILSACVFVLLACAFSVCVCLSVRVCESVSVPVGVCVCSCGGVAAQGKCQGLKWRFDKGTVLGGGRGGREGGLRTVACELERQRRRVEETGDRGGEWRRWGDRGGDGGTEDMGWWWETLKQNHRKDRAALRCDPGSLLGGGGC